MGTQKDRDQLVCLVVDGYADPPSALVLVLEGIDVPCQTTPPVREQIRDGAVLILDLADEAVDIHEHERPGGILLRDLQTIGYLPDIELILPRGLVQEHIAQYRGDQGIDIGQFPESR